MSKRQGKFNDAFDTNSDKFLFNNFRSHTKSVGVSYLAIIKKGGCLLRAVYDGKTYYYIKISIIKQ